MKTIQQLRDELAARWPGRTVSVGACATMHNSVGTRRTEWEIFIHDAGGIGIEAYGTGCTYEEALGDIGRQLCEKPKTEQPVAASEEVTPAGRAGLKGETVI